MVISITGTFVSLVNALANAQAAFAADSGATSEIVDTANPVKAGDATVSSKLVIDNQFVDPDNNCEGCTRMVYTPGSQEEAGIAYKDSKLDLSSSQRIVFFAKGQPNEQVAFVAAGNDSGLTTTNDTDVFPKINFTVVTDNVTLKNNWQRFEIGLNGTALSDATYPFGIQLSADSSQKQIFYIKGITLDDQPAQNPLPTTVDMLNSTSMNSTEPLTANINSNGTDYEAAPATIEFKASSTGGLAPYSFSWNFDDGSNATGIGEKASHTFDKPGNYTIALASRDSSTPSQNASSTKLVTISSFDNKTGYEPLTANSTTVANNTIANTTNNTIANTTNHTIANTTNHTIANTTNHTIANTTNNITGKVVNPLETVKNTSMSAFEVSNLRARANGSRDVLQPVEEVHNKTLATGQTEVKEVNNTVSAAKSGKVFDEARGEQLPTHSKKIERLTAASVKNLPVDVSNTDSVNHSPVAMDQSVTIHANKPIGIVLKGTDPDNDRVTFELISDPLRGVLAGFNKDTGTVIYIPATPNPLTPGSDSFTFKVIDTHNAESNVGRVSEIINPIPTVTSNENAGTHVGPSHQSPNSAPVVSDEKIKVGQKKNAHIILQGMDMDHGKLTYLIVKGPSHGKLIAFDSSTGRLTYRPNDNFAGQDGFKYKARNQKELDSNIAKVSIIVTGTGLNPSSTSTPDSDFKTENVTRQVSRETLERIPSANAGLDRSVNEGTNNVTLRGIGKDLDGDALSYSWAQTAGPPINLIDVNTARPSFSAPEVVGDKILRFELTVTDVKGGQDTDDVKIRIKDKDLVDNKLFQHQNQGPIIVNRTLQLYR